MSANQRQPFSIRQGYEQTKPIQREGLDDDLRKGLWNIFYRLFDNDEYRAAHPVRSLWTYQRPMSFRVLCEFLKTPADECENTLNAVNREKVKKIFLHQPWHKVFDLIEFVIACLPKSSNTGDINTFISKCGQLLEQENSAYRIVTNLVVEIISEQEIESIETAMKTPYQNVNNHIKKALTIFSHRENPDYENSVKESISALESIAQEITKKEKPLTALTQELSIHRNFQNGLNELYNWTSKTGGIRHGASGKPLHPNQNTARFMLVICSAFVNYIISSNPQQGINQ